MKKNLLVILFVLSSSTLFAQIAGNLSNLSYPPIFGTSPFQNGLADLVVPQGGVGGYDTSSSTLVYNATANLPGFTITGITGLTMHPHTGEYFMIMKVSGVSGRVLGKYNPLTAVCTQVGNLGDNFSTICYREDGQLFGVTGDGASVSETLFLIDDSTGTTTVAAALGAGNDGEIISYNYDDDFFYHWSGNGTVVFEKVMSIAPYTATNIPIVGTTNGETFGATYLGGNRFRISNISSSFNHCFANGQWTPAFGSNYDDMRGLALVARWVDRTGPASICASDSSLFVAMATPNDGNRHKFQWVRDGINIPGATSSTYYANQTGWYNCRIILDSLYTNNQTMDSAITAYTDTAWYGRSLVVNPASGLNPNPNAYICSVGDSVALINANNSGVNEWYFNGSVMMGVTNDTIWASSTGLYNVTATQVVGCVDTMATGSTVSIAPSPSLSSFGNMCFGDSTLLMANSGANNYDWFLNGSLSTSTSGNLLYVSADGNYSVVTSFGTCIDTSGVVPIDFAPLYDVTPSGSGSICIGSNQLLTATAGGSAYQWLNNGLVIAAATSQTYNATTAGTYSCLISFVGCTDTTATQYVLTTVDCSGIEEHVNAVVNIYPNPVHDKINISISNDLIIEKIEIVDLAGRKILSTNPNSANSSINVEHLSAGSYLINISSEKGVKSMKFIKY